MSIKCACLLDINIYILLLCWPYCDGEICMTLDIDDELRYYIKKTGSSFAHMSSG